MRILKILILIYPIALLGQTVSHLIPIGGRLLSSNYYQRLGSLISCQTNNPNEKTIVSSAYFKAYKEDGMDLLRLIFVDNVRYEVVFDEIKLDGANETHSRRLDAKIVDKIKRIWMIGLLDMRVNPDERIILDTAPTVYFSELYGYGLLVGQEPSFISQPSVPNFMSEITTIFDSICCE